MKYYGIIRKRKIENLVYTITKMKSFTAQFLTLSKKERQYHSQKYNMHFIRNHKLKEKDSSIPKGKYYIPVCIMTADLVMREDIPRIQSGLINLLKKQYSHKFFGTFRSVQERIDTISHMDDILSSWYNWADVGRFDFENDNLMKDVISHFDIYIRNINSSYLALEFYLYLSDGFIEKQVSVINNNYSYDRGYIVPLFMRNNKKSGGNTTYSVNHYNNALLKSDLISENINILKWQFCNRIQKYFPMLLHNMNAIPPSVNIYKTNISYRDSDADRFWESVGIVEYHGQFIDESRKLFFKTDLSGRYLNDYRTDLVYIVNYDTIRLEDGYPSIDSQILDEFSRNLSSAVFKFVLLEALNNSAAQKCVKYKSNLNSIKLKRNKLYKLLKLRYNYEKDIDFYRRYVSDNIWKKAAARIDEVFDGKREQRSYDYRILTESSILTKGKILEQISILDKDFDDKTSILQHLAAFKNERKNKLLNIIMLILTVATVTFIIFPNLSIAVADCLIQLWCLIKEKAGLLSAFILHRIR